MMLVRLLVGRMRNSEMMLTRVLAENRRLKETMASLQENSLLASFHDARADCVTPEGPTKDLPLLENSCGVDSSTIDAQMRYSRLRRHIPTLQP